MASRKKGQSAPALEGFVASFNSRDHLEHLLVLFGHTGSHAEHSGMVFLSADREHWLSADDLTSLESFAVEAFKKGYDAGFAAGYERPRSTDA